MKFRPPETASGGHVDNESCYSTVGIEFYDLIIMLILFRDYCFQGLSL